VGGTVIENTGGGAIPKDVYMVLDYAEYDLTGILESKEIRFGQDHVKSWSHQLLRGIHYMHTNKVVHRDLKCSNLLVNKRGELKIADWGLARSWNEEMKQLTTRVITLWYRPPELLLGAQTYSTKIDMWSAGCIIIEMFRRKGFLTGNTEPVQLDLIFRTCGHPTVEDWPDIDQTCKLWKKFKPEADKPRFPNRLEVALTTNLPNPSWMTPEAVAMITGLLQMNPSKRFSALDALTTTDYFFPEASVKAPSELSMDFALNSVHEFECRRNATAKANNGRQ
jgi:serine/threonine protein kinase